MLVRLALIPAVLLGALLLVVALQMFGVLKRVPFSYNVRNLLVRWPITGLTAMAFTLVVALLVFMLAFVKGMYKLTESSGVPENVMVLADGATDELFSNLGYGDIKEIELRPEVVKENGKPLASWEVYVVVNQPIPVRKCPKCSELVRVDQHDELEKHGSPECAGSGVSVRGTRGRRFIQVRGIEDPVVSGRVHNLPLYEGGSWFSAAAVEALPGSGNEQAIQAVIGEGLARELGPDSGKRSLEIGDIFELGPRKWVVKGILQSAGSTFDSEVWGKFQIVGEMFGKATFTTCVLRTTDAETAITFAEDLRTNFKKPAVAAQAEPKYYASLNTTNEQFLYGIIALAVIMSVGGVFGVMNTMFAAIAQRTKDIGVLRILGFAPWQVLVSFFLESVILAAIGGLIGCAIGSVANGWSASSVISSGQGGGGKSIVLKLVVDGTILSAGMWFALAMGCLGGLIPALSAMRMKPLDAVR